MSISELGTSHLQQTKLSELSESASGLLEPLATWLSDLAFTPHTGEEFEILAHAQLLDKIRPLLNELGLVNKVRALVNTLNFAKDTSE
jgi:hypothetical protein